ncbi:hypothetical protein [Yinghuangia aomiensis]
MRAPGVPTAQLIGHAWLNSQERNAWETRVMARRAARYEATLAVMRALKHLTPRENRPSMSVTYWERVGPNGRTFVMAKTETMTKDGHTNWLTRLVRTLSVDEYLQLIEEDDRRKTAARMTAARSREERVRMLDAFDRRKLQRAVDTAESEEQRNALVREYEHGNPIYKMPPDERNEILDAFDRGEMGLLPQYRLNGPRPLEVRSHQIMDLAWILREMSTALHLEWADVRGTQPGAFFGPHYTHYSSRDFPGGELNPGFRLGRVMGDIDWARNASKSLEKTIIRRTRVLRMQHFARYVRTELKGAAGNALEMERPVFTDPQTLAIAGACGNTSRHGRALRVPASPNFGPSPPNLPRFVDTTAAAIGFIPLQRTAVVPRIGPLTPPPAPDAALVRRSAAAPAARYDVIHAPGRTGF